MLLGWNLCTDGRDEDFRRIREDRLRAAASASKEAKEAAPSTNTYVQHVPDKCDRIVWRGHYYHLPIKAAPSQDAGALAQLRHLYANMVNGAVRDADGARRIAVGILGPAIERLERAAHTKDSATSQDAEDAARYRALRAYMLSDDTQFDDQIVAATTNAEFDSAINAARSFKGEGK